MKDLSLLDTAQGVVRQLVSFDATYKLSKYATIDHIGFRCENHQQFERLRDLHVKSSRWIYQSVISGRPIAIMQLYEGLQTPFGTTYTLELSDKKPHTPYFNGFDHVELIPKIRTVRELVLQCIQQGLSPIENVRPHHTTFDIQLTDKFGIKLSAEPLVERIIRNEMKTTYQ